MPHRRISFEWDTFDFFDDAELSDEVFTPPPRDDTTTTSIEHRCMSSDSTKAYSQQRTMDAGGDEPNIMPGGDISPADRAEITYAV